MLKPFPDTSIAKNVTARKGYGVVENFLADGAYQMLRNRVLIKVPNTGRCHRF
jgi:hypothetical protein